MTSFCHDDKRGYIPSESTKMLEQPGINEDQWLTMTRQFEQCFSTFAGNEHQLRYACEKLDYQRPSGLNRCKAALG
ncbi:hypothetical protein [Thalassolituus hydrocarboniclasticus]|uniref:Transposase n=1 Tax=Thalassolituus hydrocarboniclasticus TaxID=2742796 RepID=A0ABY6AD55_9GAMM|nr:hypothetical protein [Thalassolituus hydrocarboniclasticus]UXD88677.1 hypothetical protein HUF19_15105 [Thalassolituus hydrocarboniclasticus]